MKKLFSPLVNGAISSLDRGRRSWGGRKQVFWIFGFLRKKIGFEEPGNQETDIPSFQTKTLSFIALTFWHRTFTYKF
jgi:hypothetical protein